MTTQVSGDLRVITSTPAKITSVDVRSTTTRPSGDGLMLGQWVTLSKPGEFNAASSEVDFPAVPGPAQIKLFSGGSTVGSVALIVPDADSASLADCVRNAEMAGDRDVGELAGILEQIRGSVGASAEARAGAEAAAEDAAGSAASAGRDADRAEDAEAGAVEAEEGAVAGQELSEDAAAVAVAAAVGAAEASSDKADTTYVDAQDTALGKRITDEKWWRGRLWSDHNLDDLRGRAEQGMYEVNTVVGGGPGLGGWVEITYDSNSARTRQVFTASSPTEYVSLERTYSGGYWREWSPVTWHGVVVRSGSADDLIVPHAYAVNSTSVAGLPAEVFGTLETLPAGAGSESRLQRFTSRETVPRMWLRTRTAHTWSEWKQYTGQAGEAGEDGEDEEAGVRPHPVTYNPTETIKSSGYIPYAVSSDGMTSWNYNSNELRQSFDGGHTWQVARTFGGQSVEFVEELANGELIVATTGTVNGVRNMRRVWVSTGYDRANPSAASWEVKITGSAPMVKFVDWCFYQHDNILLMNEYGPKSGYTWAGGSSIIGEGQNARYTWMSEDYGQTWRTIFDLNAWLIDNGRPNADGQHLHGVAWDKHWDRIWITFGDNLGGTATNGIIYSDDKGVTWEAAHWTGTAESVGQVVGIQPMKDCIVFAGDMTPSGYLRIDREGGKTRTEWDVTTAWTFSDTDLHLCHSIIHREFPQGGEITLMGFSQEGTNSPSYIIATRDGYHTDLIWVDEQNRSLGLRTMAGPTDRGELIAAINTSAGTVELRGVLDIFGTDWSTVHALQDSVDDLSEDVATRAPLVHEHTASQITDLHHYSGTGFPEGRVSAPVGAIYTDTAATNGAIRWIKTSGTGNTGWRVANGDTGWRDITDGLTGSVLGMGTGAKVLIRRKLYDLEVIFVGPITLTAAWGAIWGTSQGFRPERESETVLGENARLRLGRYNARIENGTRDSELIASGRSLFTTLPSEIDWPVTLPGTPE